MSVSGQKPIAKGQAWFCTTGLPSDVVIEVDDMTFHLHKFPLMSKSRKLHNLITEQETNPGFASATGDQSHSSLAGEEEHGGGDEIEEVQCHIVLADFPGGSETFETAAKFCYGMKIDVTASNVAPLRCAGEFLEMTEEYSEDNLISKTERFLAQSVLKSLRDSIRALKSCESLTPMAEALGIPERCVDAAAARASSADPTLFGWPVGDAGDRDSSTQILWNGIDAGPGRRRKGPSRASDSESWLEEMASLSLPSFKRLIAAMSGRDLSSEMIESCLVTYAKKRIPGTSRTSRKPSTSSSSASSISESEQRELIETVISNLPSERSSPSNNPRSSPASAATRFLFGLLRTANILGVSESSKASLEKKLGSRLDQATLDDLLIPSYSYLNETLYDIDCVHRILAYFLEHISEDTNPGTAVQRGGDEEGTQSPSLMLVGKLIDGYLSEIASDANLKPDRFLDLATSLPDRARLFHDGLYRAVDVYLKAHPTVSESERERICGVLDCQRLTLEACTHAAQNERLPLRAVVQVLFFEQLQLRHAIAENLMAVEAAEATAGRPSVLHRRVPQGNNSNEDEDGDGDEADGGVTWRAAVRENQVLRLDMDSMRTRVHQLERECSTMRKVIEKIDNPGQPYADADAGVNGGWRGSLTKRFGCKFKTQVCDSQQPSSVVDTTKGRKYHRRRQHHHHQHRQQ